MCSHANSQQTQQNLQLPRFMCSSFLLLLALLRSADGFVVTPSSPTSRTTAITNDQCRNFRSTALFSDAEDSASSSVASAENNPLGLTPELMKLTNAFEAIGDDKLRYKQLLYMANQLKPMDESLKTPERKVPGCLSTVHVFSTMNSDRKVYFEGDSDGLLTKGLIALLVRGLSGNAPSDIQLVDPSFIQKAGISQSLTPGRNNGFLNMLNVMKKQALELEQQQSATTTTSTSASSSPGAPSNMKYNAIVEALQKLQPAKLELIDNSYQHAGHAEAVGDGSGETHFDLYIVADAFDGLNLVKRHKLVYIVLGEIMPTIHALQIRAQTPAEAGL